ncbi:MAG: hypothetical protein O7G32_05740 [SAR324 cluster bacterium]|nr:hypothetical protein [SAR324 cluster bacterium]
MKLWSIDRRTVFFYLALLAVLNYALLAAWYVGLDNYHSYAEPNIASTSWVLMLGEPIYHDVDAAGQYSSIYGPYLYIINGVFIRLLGPGIASAKFAGALFALLSVLGVIYAVRRISDWRTGVMAGGFLVLTYFAFWPFSTFIARADAIILGLTGLALAAVHLKSKWGCIALAALALGVCVGVKPHAAMYFLPIWMLLYQRFGWTAFFVAGCGGCAIALAPYALAENISLTNHLLWLRLVATWDFDSQMFLSSLRAMIFLQLLPVVILLSILPRPMAILRRDALIVLTVVACFAIIMPVASIDGAGKFHVLPLSIVIVYWLARVFHENYSAEAAHASGIKGFALKHKVIYLLLALMLLNAFPANRRMVKLMNHGGRFNGAVADIENIIRAHPGKKIAMGDGELKDNIITYYRPLLIFAGNPYLIDSVNIMVRKNSGYGLGAKTIAAIENCKIDIWLIAKANRPFAINSVHDGSSNLYPEYFRQAFLSTYQVRERVGLFDLWFCKDSA